VSAHRQVVLVDHDVARVVGVDQERWHHIRACSRSRSRAEEDEVLERVEVVGDKARAASDDHDALVLGIVRGSRLEEDGPLEGAAVQQASQNAEQHGER